MRRPAPSSSSSLALTLALLAAPAVWLGAACSDDPPPSHNAGDGGASSDAADRPDAGPSDADGLAPDTAEAPDMGRAACVDAPGCEANERLVACECQSVYDRSCVTSADCRDTETCEEVEGLRLCWYEAPPVASARASGVLRAAATSKSVTPEGFETPTAAGIDEDNYLSFVPDNVSPEVWNDCGYDGLCPGDPGYVEADEGEGDGELQGMWIAGFGIGRPAQYCPEELIGCERPECCVSKFAHDDIRVQIAVVEVDEMRVAFATLDTVGFFHTDIERIREQIPEALGIDLFVMAATHNHEAPDTAGQWGPGTSLPTEPGRNPRFMQRITDQTLAGLAEAVESLEPAEVAAGVLDVGVEGLAISDSRTPYIFDDNVPVVRLRAQDDGATIATLLSFANHAEVLWSKNPYLSADYPNFVRAYIEQGLEAVLDPQGAELKPSLPGVGGVTLMFAGAVGGLINPGRGGAKAYDDSEPAEAHSYAAADAVGQRLASHVLGAIHEGRLDEVDGSALSFATKRFLTPVQNKKFQLAAFQLGLLPRDVYNVVPKSALSFGPGLPMLLSQMAVVRLGPITFFTAPGEVFPETLVGGYPGRPRVQTPVVGDIGETRAPAVCDAQGLPVDGGSLPCIVHPDQENPPDWASAPEGPYVYELIPGDYPFFIGVGMDFLGYFVPEYDYEEVGYLSQAPGDHYEETNGVGGSVLGDWKQALQLSLDVLAD